MGGGVVRLQFYCQAITGDGLVEPLLFSQHVSQIVMGVGIIGLDFHRAAVAIGRVVELSLLLQDVAEVIVGAGELRHQLQSTAIAGDCLRKPLQGLVSLAQVVVEDSDVAANPDRAADEVDGRLVTADLMRDHAQEMERVGLIRFGPENVLIDSRGGFQPTVLVVLNCLR